MNESQGYSTGTLVAVAGCQAATFHKWRSRNGLFAVEESPSGWNRWTIIAICVAKLVTVLTKHGLSAEDAVWIADGPHIGGISQWIEEIIADENSPVRFIAVAQGDTSAPDSKVFDAISGKVKLNKELPSTHLTLTILSKEKSSLEKIMEYGPGAVTIIDLKNIVESVKAALSDFESNREQTKGKKYARRKPELKQGTCQNKTLGPASGDSNA